MVGRVFFLLLLLPARHPRLVPVLLPPLPPVRELPRVTLPFLPPRLPPRPNLLAPAPVLTPLLPMPGEVSFSHPTGFWPISRSGYELVAVVAVLLFLLPSGTRVVAITLRANQPPRSRERKMGRRAGAEAVMSARLVSMADETKPTLDAELGKMGMLKRPWTRSIRRTMEVMVTLHQINKSVSGCTN